MFGIITEILRSPLTATHTAMTTKTNLTFRLLACVALIVAPSLEAKETELTKASIADIQQAFESGSLTSERLVSMYLERIEQYDQNGPKINSFLHVNPNAVEEARKLDAERTEIGPRGPMHGIPVVIKDVLDTYDMPTTGGFLPLKGVVPTKDAFIVKKFREAGAIILGKTNQADWYSLPEIVTASSLGGTTKNPFNLEYTSGESSSGTGGALAARLAQVGIGSETGYSVRTPTSDSNLYGISATSGLISRDGQMGGFITGERAGPMARSMYDLAVTLDVIAGFDPMDLWTARSLGMMPPKKYVEYLDREGLSGAHVGVLKEAYSFEEPRDNGLDLAESAIQVFLDNGARVVRDVSLGIDLKATIANGFPSRFERMHMIEMYITRQGPNYPFKNPREMLLEQNLVKPIDRDVELIENPVDLDRNPEYHALMRSRFALRDAVIELMDRYDLDALIFPHKLNGPVKLVPRDEPDAQYTPNQLSPLAGLPSIIVPAGFTSIGTPIGFEIMGRPWSEPTLLRIASGYEAKTDLVRVPETTPNINGHTIAAKLE